MQATPVGAWPLAQGQSGRADMRRLPPRGGGWGWGPGQAGLQVKGALEEGQLLAPSRNQPALGGPLSPASKAPTCQSIMQTINRTKEYNVANALSEPGSACLSGEVEKAEETCLCSGSTCQARHLAVSKQELS